MLGKGVQQRIKELALKYKSSNDSLVFEQILLLIDGLLRGVVNRARRSKPYLRKIEWQDLYNATIIGVYRAISKVKEDEDSGILISRIIFYAGDEISSWSKKLRTEFIPRNNDNRVEVVVDDSSVYQELENEFIQDRFKKLLKEGVLEKEEFDMLWMNVVEGMTLKDIAKQMGYTNITVLKRIRSTLDRLRYEFRRRGWDE